MSRYEESFQNITNTFSVRSGNEYKNLSSQANGYQINFLVDNINSKIIMKNILIHKILINYYQQALYDYHWHGIYSQSSKNKIRHGFGHDHKN
eukprot:193348_1